MSGTVSISVRWDGTAISVTNIHDPESEGSPADSTTKAHDIIGMLRDCALRAEDAVAASLVPQKERMVREELRRTLQTNETITAIRQALHHINRPDDSWDEVAEESQYLVDEAWAVVSAILGWAKEQR